MKYKLSDFGLNKQSLKRKLPEIIDETIMVMVENILNERTTTYSLSEIEFIIDVLYSDKYDRKISDKPLGVFYSGLNREKYDKLKSLVEIKKTGSITKSLEKDVKKLINKSNYDLMSEDEYKKELEKISEKYGIMMSEIYKILNRIENEWLNNIIA